MSDETLIEREWNDPYEMQSEEQLSAKAEERNCTLLVADAATLLVDLDTPAQLAQFERMVSQIKETVRSRVDIRQYEVLRSRNGGWHGIVELSPGLDFPERVALQAILGSDPLREFLLLTEHMLCGEAVNCLFRPADSCPVPVEGEEVP